MNYPRGYPYYSSQPSYNYSEYQQPNSHSKLSQNIHCHTRPAFEAAERFIGSFHELVRVLESTVVATHSSFNAILQLSHQYSTIKHSLKSILGVFSMLHWLKNKLNTFAPTLSVQEFDTFCTQQSRKAQQKFNKAPLVLFLCLTAIPALISYLLSSHRQKQQQQIIELPTKKSKVQPKKLDFARALYSFKAESAAELSLEPNDLIAILSKDASSGWWRGRLKNGKTGYFPANHVEVIEKKATLDIPPSPTLKNIAPSA